MRLKKLKIVGFKSFADKVVLDFDREIIGIVGPNGCGKSNIVDAFRWVMGEQSVKSMRASAMQDVLFAGTQKRPPQNFAEVEITLTDVAEALNTPYEEVTITRRLYRNGESEYRLNKQSVRLRDIHHLFLGTGVGKNAFSVFEQGKIDQVIHLAPQSRRAIFDEAAGIGLFLEKRKESVRKLEKVSENFNRIRAVYVEVEKQASTLKRQAKLAKTYQHNKERLAYLERGIKATKLRALLETGAEKEREKCALEEALTTKQSGIETLTARVEEERKSVQSEERAAQTKREALYESEKRYEVQKVEIDRAQERLEELSTQLETLFAEQNRLNTVQSEPSIDIATPKQTYTALQQEVEELEKRREEHAQAHLSALRTSKKAHEARFLESEIAEHTTRLAQSEKEREKRQSAHRALCAASAQLKQEWERARQMRQEQEREQESVRAQIAELTAREKLHSGGEEKLLQAFPKTLKPLLEAIAPLKGCEKALEAVLHRYGDTLLVPTQKEALAVLAYAEEHGIDDFSLLPLDLLHTKKATLAKKGPLASHFAIELFDALTLTRSGVTKEGIFVDHFGVIFRTPFEGRVELAHIKEQRLEKESALAALTLVDPTPLEEKWRKEEMRSLQENFHVQQSAKEGEKIKKQIAHLEKKRAALGPIATAEQDIEALQKEVEACDTLLAEKRPQLRQATEVWRAAERQEAARQARLEAQSERKGKISEEIAECEKYRILCEKGLLARQTTIGQLADQVEICRAQFQAHTDESEKKRIHLTALEEQLTAQKKEAGELHAQLHQLEVASASTEAARTELERDLDDPQAQLDCPLEEAERTARTLKVTLEKSASVNMLAIEAYAEEEKRVSHLKEQSDDLEKAKKELEQIIMKLDQESRALFKETFEKIRENFQKNFSILFEGGEADLRFTDSVDVLEAGIEIVAKPPGKRLRAISLLSGGEKCLTALALLFALFQVRRAPFCILDEVDAPLDESNIGRFTEMLRQFTDKTQFLIVTHNKKTMAIADTLIGVSMEEKGVSKLLSLTFEKKPAEASA